MTTVRLDRIRKDAEEDSKSDLAYLLRRHDQKEADAIAHYDAMRACEKRNVKLESILSAGKLILSVDWQHLDLTLVEKGDKKK